MSKSFTVAVAGSSVAANSTKTLVVITAPSNRIVRVKRIRGSQRTINGSQQMLISLQRASAAGTSTANTPAPDEDNGGAAGSTVGVNCTVEPTYTAGKVLASDDWNALMGSDLYWPPEDRKVVPPSGIVGIALINPTGNSAVAPDMVVEFEEIG